MKGTNVAVMGKEIQVWTVTNPKLVIEIITDGWTKNGVSANENRKVYGFRIIIHVDINGGRERAAYYTYYFSTKECKRKRMTQPHGTESAPRDAQHRAP